MTAEVIGLKRSAFQGRDGRAVQSVKYIVTFTSPEIDEGKMSDSLSWNEIEKGKAPYNVGDTVEVTYTSGGKLMFDETAKNSYKSTFDTK